MPTELLPPKQNVSGSISLERTMLTKFEELVTRAMLLVSGTTGDSVGQKGPNPQLRKPSIHIGFNGHDRISQSIIRRGITTIQ